MTTYRPEAVPSDAVPSTEEGWPDGTRRSAPDHRRDRFAEPAPFGLEPVARMVDERAGGAWRAPVAVAVASFVGIAAVLTLLGVLLVHTSLGQALRDWDQTLSADVAARRTSGWSDYSDVGTSAANTLPVIAGLVLVSAVLAALRRWRDVLLLPLALGLELSTFLTVNQLVGRERPAVPQLGGEPGTNSFPSGHVAATFVLCIGIAVLLGVSRWRLPYRILGWLVAAAPVATVAFSRVYRGMHFMTDVLGGMVLGALALAAAVVATRSSWLGSHRPSGAR